MGSSNQTKTLVIHLQLLYTSEFCERCFSSGEKFLLVLFLLVETK